jgi:uncharacterized SAM-binding protein YcdF (DUF218 family)
METLPLPFLLKKFAAALLLPPLLPLLIIFAGLLLLRRRPRMGHALAWGGLLVAWLLSTPVVVNLITTPLEDVPLLQPQDLARGEAIVILGAGAHRFMPEYGGPGPHRLALERLRFGARLARASGLPVLVSGEAGPMTDSLRTDFGVAPDWLEGGSLDTEDNARNTVEILRGKGVERIVLVTHAAHMRRSMAEFEVHGIQVIAAPTGFFSRYEGDEPRVWFLDYLPGPAAAYTAWYVLHEWTGLLALKLRTLAR